MQDGDGDVGEGRAIEQDLAGVTEQPSDGQTRDASLCRCRQEDERDQYGDGLRGSAHPDLLFNPVAAGRKSLVCENSHKRITDWNL